MADEAGVGRSTLSAEGCCCDITGAGTVGCPAVAEEHISRFGFCDIVAQCCGKAGSSGCTSSATDCSAAVVPAERAGGCTDDEDWVFECVVDCPGNVLLSIGFIPSMSPCMTSQSCWPRTGGHGRPEMVPNALVTMLLASLVAGVEVAGADSTCSVPSCSTIVSFGELRISSWSISWASCCVLCDSSRRSMF